VALRQQSGHGQADVAGTDNGDFQILISF
jgi:hypothetical protein